MQKYTPDEYKKILDKLPPVIRESVLSMDTTNLIWKIGENKRIHLDKIGIMHDLIMDTMMGIVTVKNLPNELSKELDLPSVEIIPIMNEVNEKIFKPVREAMEKTFSGGSPNKLRTINTADENDEEHLHLTKHDVLREIENPVPTEVKTLYNDKTQDINEKLEKKTLGISKITEIQEYPQELIGNKIDLRMVDDLQLTTNNNKQKEEVSKSTQPQKNPVIMPSSPKTIAEMKLSNVTSIEKENTIIEEKNEFSPQVQIKIDPYREPTA